MSGNNSPVCVGGMSPGVSGVFLCVLRAVSSACTWTGAESNTISWLQGGMSGSSPVLRSGIPPPMSGGGGQLSPGSGPQQQVLHLWQRCTCISNRIASMPLSHAHHDPEMNATWLSYAHTHSSRSSRSRSSSSRSSSSSRCVQMYLRQLQMIWKMFINNRKSLHWCILHKSTLNCSYESLSRTHSLPEALQVSEWICWFTLILTSQGESADSLSHSHLDSNIIANLILSRGVLLYRTAQCTSCGWHHCLG